jgi:hypothetical protein
MIDRITRCAPKCEPAFSCGKSKSVGYVSENSRPAQAGSPVEYLVHRVEPLDVCAICPAAHVGNASSILAFCISSFAFFCYPQQPKSTATPGGETDPTHNTHL